MLLVLISTNENIPPVKNEYPACKIDSPTQAPDTILARCETPKIADDMITATRTPCLFVPIRSRSAIWTTPRKAASSKSPTKKHSMKKSMI